MKYGPEEKDEMIIEVKRDETKSNLLRMVTEKIAAIRELEERIESIRCEGRPVDVSSPPKKKRKADTGSATGGRSRRGKRERHL